MKIAIILLVTALVIVSGAFLYYFYTTQPMIKALSDNNTKIQSNFEILAKEYTKIAQPKVFQSEDDLKKWLSSDDQSVSGYLALAKQQGAFMQIWPAWKLSDRYAGVDFTEKWQETKAQVIGMKYALLTIVDKKTYIIDVDTKRLIPLGPDSTGDWK